MGVAAAFSAWNLSRETCEEDEYINYLTIEGLAHVQYNNQCNVISEMALDSKLFPDHIAVS